MKPTKRDDGQFGDRYDHPAFGCVSVGHPHGTGRGLFMSNVKHNRTVSLRIATASMRRGLGSEEHTEEKQIVEVELSPVQWADLLAGNFTGSGVPCTLRWVQGETPPPIDMETVLDRHAAESRALMRKLAADVDNLTKTLRASLTSAKVSKKKQDEILAPAVRLEQDLRANLPFAQDQFARSLEDVASEAKALIEAYAEQRGIERQDVPRIEDGRED